MSTEYQLSNGSHPVTIEAPGYETVVRTVEVDNPTNCGCCGCCPFSATVAMELEPDGTPVAGCCADTTSDPENCGGCGNHCPAGVACVEGRCETSPTCSEAVKDLEQFVAANRSCQLDDECTTAYVECAPIRDLCDGSLYLSKTHDAGQLATLVDTWTQCGGTVACALCDLLPPPARCVAGRCGFQ
jgi:hypothetical protein